MKKVLTFLLAMMLGTILTLGVQAQRERHPRINSAIHALEDAREEMRAASHDYGGHRERALKACDAAIRELRECLRY